MAVYDPNRWGCGASCAPPCIAFGAWEIGPVEDSESSSVDLDDARAPHMGATRHAREGPSEGSAVEKTRSPARENDQGACSVFDVRKELNTPREVQLPVGWLESCYERPNHTHPHAERRISSSEVTRRRSGRSTCTCDQQIPRTSVPRVGAADWRRDRSQPLEIANPFRRSPPHAPIHRLLASSDKLQRTPIYSCLSPVMVCTSPENRLTPSH